MEFRQWLLTEGSVEVGQIINVTDKRNGQNSEYRVLAIRGDKVYLWPTNYGDPGDNLYGSIVMPLASVSHFIGDLGGQVNVNKKTGDPAIDAVIDGKGEFLGKGDDGVAFGVGDEVVKMSTTVPYVPSNPGHRYPSKAARMIYGEVKAAKELRELGVPAILPYRLKIVGDKAFLVRPKVDILENLTREQLETVRESIKQMHEHDWAHRDMMQVGLWNGQLYHYDLGKAKKTSDKIEFESDMRHLQILYDRNNQRFVPFGETLREKWDHLVDPKGLWQAEKRLSWWNHFMHEIDECLPYVLKELPDITDAQERYDWIKENIKKPEK